MRYIRYNPGELAYFVQSEKNGSRFYKDLSEYSNAYREEFERISVDCVIRMVMFLGMCKSIGMKFTAENASVPKVLELRESVSFAISEETENLRRLGVFYETCGDADAKKISSVIHKKTADLFVLYKIERGC
ncbi:hypothetical protein AGMMS49975_13340 [Clostridia bacterium]|nr:hypothetical protein AGMMS49975_13340 [Clostridia bacterium]